MNLIFKNHSIRHDGLQYILSVKRISKGEKSKGQEVESVLGYYANESQLLKGLIKFGMADDAIESIEQIKEMITAATQRVLTEETV